MFLRVNNQAVLIFSANVQCILINHDTPVLSHEPLAIPLTNGDTHLITIHPRNCAPSPNRWQHLASVTQPTPSSWAVCASPMHRCPTSVANVPDSDTPEVCCVSDLLVEQPLSSFIRRHIPGVQRFRIQSTVCSRDLRSFNHSLNVNQKLQSKAVNQINVHS